MVWQDGIDNCWFRDSVCFPQQTLSQRQTQKHSSARHSTVRTTDKHTAAVPSSRLRQLEAVQIKMKEGGVLAVHKL